MAYVDRIQVKLTQAAGSVNVPLPQKIGWLRFTGAHPRDLVVYEGYGTGVPICRIRGYEQRDIELPVPVDSITVSWGVSPVSSVDNAIVDIVASSEALSTSGGQSTTVSLSFGEGRGEPVPWMSAGSPVPSLDNIPLVALASFDPTTGTLSPNAIDNGVPVERRAYHAVVRRTARDLSTNTAFAAAGRTLLATLWNAGSGTPYTRLLRAEVAVLAATAACEFWVDLVRINTIPTGGSDITPVGATSWNPASWTACKRLPTGGGAESSDPISSRVWRIGITAADSTVNPAPPPNWQTIYEQSIETEGLASVATGQGFALVADINAASTVRWIARLTWLEDNFV